jgi:recombination protein RecA
MPSSRKRKLDALVARLQLEYGPRAIHKAAPAPESVACLSTTFADLDTALGGGLPCGRITEIIGPATSGKVTLAAKTLSAAHAERDALVAWLDLPLTCDPDHLHRCGLDLDRLLIVRPHDAADALAIALHLVESSTLAALVFDGTVDLAQVDSALVAGSLQRLAPAVTRTQTAVIFLSEPHAPSMTLAHVAAIQRALQRERWITRDQDIRGYEGQVEVLKHKLGRAGALVPIRIVFNGTVRGKGL